MANAKDGRMTVELVGDLSPAADLGSGAGPVLLLYGKPCKPTDKAKDLLRAWLDHLVRAARGAEHPRARRLLDGHAVALRHCAHTLLEIRT